MSSPMNEGGFSFDFKDFNQKFLKYALETAPAAAEKGMFEAISELKNDADNVIPKTPHLEGNLRGDYTIIVEGITQSKVVEVGSKNRSGAKPAERFGAHSIIAKLIFRMPYAAKWHEAVGKKINWSEGGVGPKYVESKLMMFAKKYMAIIGWNVAAAKSGESVRDVQWNPTGDEGQGDDNPRF
jgi:hypothetical protein